MCWAFPVQTPAPIWTGGCGWREKWILDKVPGALWRHIQLSIHRTMLQKVLEYSELNKWPWQRSALSLLHMSGRVYQPVPGSQYSPRRSCWESQTESSHPNRIPREWATGGRSNYCHCWHIYLQHSGLKSLIAPSDWAKIPPSSNSGFIYQAFQSTLAKLHLIISPLFAINFK